MYLEVRAYSDSRIDQFPHLQCGGPHGTLTAGNGALSFSCDMSAIMPSLHR